MGFDHREKYITHSFVTDEFLNDAIGALKCIREMACDEGRDACRRRFGFADSYPVEASIDRETIKERDPMAPLTQIHYDKEFIHTVALEWNDPINQEVSS